MFKAILHEKQILIVLLWSGLIFIGYNVLTAEASSASEIKDVCKKMDGEWKKGECKFKDGVEMGKPYSKEQYQVDFDHYIADKGLADDYYNEIAAKEDAICDNEDADTTDIKLCMSEDRLQQAAFNIGKEECKEANGEWKKDRCTYYEDEQQKQEDSQQIIKDWRNTVEEKGPEQIILEQWEKNHGSVDDEVKIPSTRLEFNDEEEREKYEKEMEKYEVETIEPTDDGTPDPDPEEEEESDDEESEDGEQEEDEPEEENSDSES